jgi:hypothetical protein
MTVIVSIIVLSLYGFGKNFVPEGRSDFQLIERVIGSA